MSFVELPVVEHSASVTLPTPLHWGVASLLGPQSVINSAALMQIASVMGISVSADLLEAAYPIATTAEALEQDLLELEKANFLRPTDVPGTWLMTQVGAVLHAALRSYAATRIMFGRKGSAYPEINHITDALKERLWLQQQVETCESSQTLCLC